MGVFYTIFIHLLAFGLKVFSFLNDKARQGIVGRKKSFEAVQNIKNKKVIWMHAASLGEYEQGLPVLERLKKEFPQHKILVTFFSPSGYENVVKKNHPADAICYLPFDKKSEIKRFVSLFQTEIFFTIKYDFWYHLLAELKQQGAKIFVVSALFYEKQIFFKPYGKWFVQQLKQNIDTFFHQTEKSKQLAVKIGLEKSVLSGDTRFDRVKHQRERDNFVPFIEEFKADKKLIVFGSSWEAEEKIAQLVTEKSDAKIIIAPHDIKREIKFNSQKPIVRYSKAPFGGKGGILVIDSIGLLSKLYSYADIAVVGGGFHSKGLHNILEAATFGKPVLFGNQYRKNPEADALIHAGGGKSFTNEQQTADFILELLNNEDKRQEMSEKSKLFIDVQPNATEIVLREMIKDRI